MCVTLTQPHLSMCGFRAPANRQYQHGSGVYTVLVLMCTGSTEAVGQEIAGAGL